MKYLIWLPIIGLILIWLHNRKKEKTYLIKYVDQMSMNLFYLYSAYQIILALGINIIVLILTT